MPRNVRNFWIEGSVDGVASSIGTGPRAKEGGFSLTIKQRDRGGIVKALDVRGYVRGDRLILEVQSPKGVLESETVR